MCPYGYPVHDATLPSRIPHPAMPNDLADFPDRDSLGRTLGIEIVEAGPARVVATMPVGPRVHQPLGYLHGGASVALAETVVSVGAYLAAPEGHTAFGMEINANHLRPMRAGVLTATATPVHVGRTSAGVAGRPARRRGHLVCTSRCTLAIVPLRAGRRHRRAGATEPLRREESSERRT